MVKKGAVAVLGILVFCSLYLALFRSHLGLGILLLPVLLVVFVLLHLSSEISELRERVEILEKKLTCTEVTSKDPVPTAEIREADAENWNGCTGIIRTKSSERFWRAKNTAKTRRNWQSRF